jgi:hypothetical protein
MNKMKHIVVNSGIQRMPRWRVKIIRLLAAALVAANLISHACTIFVLTDGEHVLFFNNEDWENPRTRLWFIPAAKGYYGCAYVGFDNGWAQGGVNTEGVAFDWVAGFNDTFEPASGLKLPRGNPSQRMLETCASVKEAIAFYQQNSEPSFSRARILIADKTGASVIIGAKDGKLSIEQSDRCRGFGYGADVVERMLAKKPHPDVQSGVKILKAALQKGQNATKYSNVFDLITGDIHILDLQRGNRGVKLNLGDEFAKGAHYYDIPELKSQLREKPRALLANMQRLPMDKYKSIADDSPEIRDRIKRILTEGSEGGLRSGDFSKELWIELSPQLNSIRDELKNLGPIRELARVETQKTDRPRTYRYRIDFQNAITLQSFVLDENNRLLSIQTEDIEQRASTK